MKNMIALTLMKVREHDSTNDMRGGGAAEFFYSIIISI